MNKNTTLPANFISQAAKLVDEELIVDSVLLRFQRDQNPASYIAYENLEYYFSCNPGSLAHTIRCGSKGFIICSSPECDAYPDLHIMPFEFLSKRPGTMFDDFHDFRLSLCVYLENLSHNTEHYNDLFFTDSFRNTQFTIADHVVRGVPY